MKSRMKPGKKCCGNCNIFFDDFDALPVHPFPWAVVHTAPPIVTAIDFAGSNTLLVIPEGNYIWKTAGFPLHVNYGLKLVSRFRMHDGIADTAAFRIQFALGSDTNYFYAEYKLALQVDSSVKATLTLGKVEGGVDTALVATPLFATFQYQDYVTMTVCIRPQAGYGYGYGSGGGYDVFAFVQGIGISKSVSTDQIDMSAMGLLGSTTSGLFAPDKDWDVDYYKIDKITSDGLCPCTYQVIGCCPERAGETVPGHISWNFSATPTPPLEPFSCNCSGDTLLGFLGFDIGMFIGLPTGSCCFGPGFGAPPQSWPRADFSGACLGFSAIAGTNTGGPFGEGETAFGLSGEYPPGAIFSCNPFHLMASASYFDPFIGNVNWEVEINEG